MAIKRVTRNISLTPEMEAKLLETAQREDRNVSRVIRRALRTYWQAQEQKSGGTSQSSEGQQ